MKPEKKLSTGQRKLTLLKALSKTYGIASEACKNTDISLDTYYMWFNKDPDFKAQVLLIRDVNLDICEKVVYDAVSNADVDTAKWVLRYRGKERGYSEKISQDINITDNTIRFKFGNDEVDNNE